MRPRAKALLPGDPVHLGTYQVTGRLGAGAYGTVFLAQDPASRLVAIKVVKPTHAPENDLSRYEREVGALRRIRSPRVVTYLDHGEDPSHGLWLALEYVNGASLYDWCRPLFPAGRYTAEGWQQGERPMVGYLLLNVLQDLLVGLRDLHGAGVMHRDLHPGNVMVPFDVHKVHIRPPAYVVLLDLGLSLHGNQRFTTSAEAIGHWVFTPPEQRSY